MILVTGAAGKTGLAVIRQLASRKVPVRALVRHAAQQDAVVSAGASEVVVGELTSEADIATAVRDVRAIYLICPNMSPDEVAIGHLVIAQAQRAGVDHLVYHSVLHPQVEAMPHHWAKLRVEEILFESGLDFTILQPAAYMQNLLPQWSSIRERGIYSIPYAASTRLGMVDLEDVATAAATVLCEPDHLGATYELANAEVLSQLEVAQVMAGVLRRDVRVEVVARDDWAQRSRAAGLTEYAIESLLAMFRYYEQHGFWGNATVLEMLLGRRRTGFEEFCARQSRD